uniref:Tyrosine-protein kinase n=2 Tax=Panagrolaimus sp. JU765 TaxID=591449 RepID=A0AC34QZM5_9BILA
MPPKKSGQSREVFKKPGQVGLTSLNASEPRIRKKASLPTEKSQVTQTTKSIADSKKIDDEEYDKEILKTLIHHEWYHGMMPRDEIEEMLKKDGDFLVRQTDVAGKSRYAVSVFNKTRIRHILMSYQNGQWIIRDQRKKTIIELIEHLLKTQTPVQIDGTILITPVPRPEYYILHEHIDIGKKLGGGAFGDVHIGTWKKGNGEEVSVAIKKLKGMMHKKERCEFVKEARVMRKFKHQNLVQLIGIAPNEPMLIILELCPGGSLQSYLKSHPDTQKDKLIQFATDSCRGLCYLSVHKCIHRDIAARNCLLGKNDEVKISDFGLSVANTDVLKLTQLKSMPIRWLSPETLKKGEFSTKSDVWSFGVMLWEIFSHCKSDPFPGENNAQARNKILSGHDPLDAPENMPALMHSVMKLCFTQDPASRPDFEVLLKIMSPKEIPPAKEH